MTDEERIELAAAKALNAKHEMERIENRFSAEYRDLDAKHGWYFMTRQDDKAADYRAKMEALEIARRHAKAAFKSAAAKYVDLKYFSGMLAFETVECTCTPLTVTACPVCRAQIDTSDIPF